MRGYLTRTGLGVVAGLAFAALVLGGWALESTRGLTATSLSAARFDVQGPMTVGPFRVAVERVELRCDGDAPRAYVQMHLWRPDGPVPVEERVRIDGLASLNGPWVLERADWLIKNEYLQIPAGASYYHPELGVVPATEHPGEARAVFEFRRLPGVESCPAEPVDFRFELPNGAGGTLPRLQLR